jgi:hypothetical protein
VPELPHKRCRRGGESNRAGAQEEGNRAEEGEGARFSMRATTSNASASEHASSIDGAGAIHRPFLRAHWWVRSIENKKNPTHEHKTSQDLL